MDGLIICEEESCQVDVLTIQMRLLLGFMSSEWSWMIQLFYEYVFVSRIIFWQYTEAIVVLLYVRMPD